MTVKELIAQLQSQDQGAMVKLMVRDAKDAAFTTVVETVETDVDGTVVVNGWVSPDDEGACAPWSID